MKKIISKTSLIIFLIFLLTFFLRVYKLPNFISFHQDQVRDLFYISDFFKEKKIILLGPKASVGDFYLPPFWYYLMSLSYFFSSSPLAPAILTAFLSSLSVFFIFKLTKDLFNKQIGYLTSSIYSFSSLSIEYSRFAWNPNPVPLFSVMTFYFLYQYLKNKKLIYFILGTITANLSLQLHYQGVIIFLFYFLIVLIYKKFNLKNFFIYLTSNFILILPFIIFEFLNNYPNLKGIINFIFSSSQNQLRLFGIPFYLKFIVFDFSQFIANTLFFKNHIFGYLGLLIFFYNLINFLIIKKNKINLIEKLLNYFFIFSLLVFFIYRNSLINFYLLFLIPFMIIYFVISLKNVFPNFFSQLLIIIFLLNVIFIPVYKKYDNTYLSLIEITNTLSKYKNYCIQYDIFKETFIEDKLRYMFFISKNPPKPTCQDTKNIFYICEPAKCQSKKYLKYKKIVYKTSYYIRTFQIINQ